MRRYPDAHPVTAPIFSTRSAWYLVVVVVLLVAGLLLGQALLLMASLLILGLGIFPKLWQYVALFGVTVQRTLGAHRVLLGEEILLTLQVENRKLLPVPRLDIEDDVPNDGLAMRGTMLEISDRAARAFLVNTFSLWTLQRITRSYHVRCLARGVYTFGPLRLIGGDPSGMLIREQVLGDHEELLVYPLTVPLDWLGLVPHDLFGTHHAIRLLEDPLHSVSVRDYMPGDDPRRIHWKATARLGRLQSKVYEHSAHRTLALFLDVRTSAQPALTGFDSALVELMVCATASVASWATQQGDGVGLYANGTLVKDQASLNTLAPTPIQTPKYALHRFSYIRLKPSAGAQQFVRVQEALARFVPFFTADLAEMLLRDSTHLPVGAAIVVVGTSYSLNTASKAALRTLQTSGHPVAVLLAGVSKEKCDAVSTDNEHEHSRSEAEEAKEKMPADLPTVLLGDASTWTMLLGKALVTCTEKSCADGPRSPDSENKERTDERLYSDNRSEAQRASFTWRLETHP